MWKEAKYNASQIRFFFMEQLAKARVWREHESRRATQIATITEETKDQQCKNPKIYGKGRNGGVVAVVTGIRMESGKKLMTD